MTTQSYDTIRTTGWMLKAIGEAHLQPGKWIEFESDRTYNDESAKLWKETLETLAQKLELQSFHTRTDGARVLVMIKAIGRT